TWPSISAGRSAERCAGGRTRSRRPGSIPTDSPRTSGSGTVPGSWPGSPGTADGLPGPDSVRVDEGGGGRGYPAATTMTRAAARYRESGVDIASKYEAVERATDAIRKTFTPGVVGDVGSFGGLFDPARVGAADQILVASADGVGTKLEVAKRARVYD